MAITPATTSGPRAPVGDTTLEISSKSMLAGNCTASVMPVLISPGQTQFTRTPRLAYSMAMLRLMASTPPLLAE